MKAVRRAGSGVSSGEAAALEPISAAQARLYEAAVRLFVQKGATQVSVSELAEAAGVARGTVYNNVEHAETLFQRVAARLSAEMQARVQASLEGLDDPAERLANGVRFFLRRAHEEPDWGRFLCRFGLSNPALQTLWSGAPARSVQSGVDAGRFKVEAEQFPSVMALLGGGVLGAMLLVLEGHRTWRDAGADLSELVLRGLGVPPKEARKLARAPLPPLPAAS